jgi:hypothetical protein
VAATLVSLTLFFRACFFFATFLGRFPDLVGVAFLCATLFRFEVFFLAFIGAV